MKSYKLKIALYKDYRQPFPTEELVCETTLHATVQGIIDYIATEYGLAAKTIDLSAASNHSNYFSSHGTLQHLIETRRLYIENDTIHLAAIPSYEVFGRVPRGGGRSSRQKILTQAEYLEKQAERKEQEIEEAQSNILHLLEERAAIKSELREKYNVDLADLPLERTVLTKTVTQVMEKEKIVPSIHITSLVITALVCLGVGSGVGIGIGVAI